MTDFNIRVSEDVPRDEVWFVQRLPWTGYVTPTGFVLQEHFQIIGKILNLSVPDSDPK